MPETADTLKAAEIAGKPSFDDIRRLVRVAILGEGDMRIDGYVVEISATDAILSMGGRNFRYPYTLKNGAVEVGAPVEVQMTWKDAASTKKADEAEEPGNMAFVTDLQGMQFAESGPVRIEVCRDGTWKHPQYGEITVTPEMRSSFIANFKSNVREVGDLPLDYDHQPSPAPGWIKGLRSEGKSLFAEVELTPSGREKLKTGEYRFFSPEWNPDWTNPRTGKKHGPTLFGGALTNKPFFRGMAAIQCSEKTTGDADAPPQETSTMPEDVKKTGGASNPTPEADRTATEQERTLTASEAQQLREQVASLQAREERRELGDTLAGLRFSEGRQVLAPGSRTALTEALLAVPAAAREQVIDAVKSLQFAELGERGFIAAEGKAGTGTEQMSEERKKELLGATPLGTSVLAEKK